jgi:hypothetical protein
VKQGVVLAVVLVPLLLATAGVSFWAWDQLGSTEMDPQGYAALVMGAVATLVIGGGLMWLVFYSSRHGYDERAGRDPEQD